MLRENLALVEQMLDEGASRKSIAEAIGCSAPAVTQFVRREPALRRFRTRRSLLAQRTQLLLLRHDVHRLAREVRNSIRELNEELESDRIDQILGLR